jgi:hypothetical protein
MNPFVVILMAVFSILMVVFGHHPGRDAREKKLKALEGKDPLIVSIEEYNAKSHSTGSSILGNTGGDSNTGGVSILGMPGRASTNFNSYSNPDASLLPGRVQGNIVGETGGAAIDPNPDYYPPQVPVQQATPDNQGGTSSRGARIRPLTVGPQSYNQPNYPTFTLGTGQKVRFSGVKVYTMNARNEVVPMPDGRYPMDGGRISLVIRGGKKMMTYH